jgi:hypothetical protein
MSGPASGTGRGAGNLPQVDLAHPQPVATAVRYDSRDGSAAPVELTRTCPVCTLPLSSSRARYCSDGCKQRAYRLRQVNQGESGHATLRRTLQRQRRLAAATVYECPLCESRLLGERRCADCNRFCRALGLGGPCPHCDELVVIADLLGEEVGP